MKLDMDIKRDVESELTWDPSVDSRDIGVIVNAGIVTLTGDVNHFSARWAVENITKRVVGVRAIANEVKVKIPLSGARSDADIAGAAANAIEWHIATGMSEIKPVVQSGWVTLSGQVSWGFQKSAAEKAVRHLMGVQGVTNEITVVSTIKIADVKQKIESAFRRHAVLDAKDIEVEVQSSTVTLKGHVHTWQEHEDAESAAWAAPGVALVDNRLSIQA